MAASPERPISSQGLHPTQAGPIVGETIGILVECNMYDVLVERQGWYELCQGSQPAGSSCLHSADLRFRATANALQHCTAYTNTLSTNLLGAQGDH